MARSVLVALLVASLAISALGKVYFKETFDDDWESRWAQSKVKPREGFSLGKFKLTPGEHHGDEEISKGIQTSQDARFYAVSSAFSEPFTNKDQDAVIQYSVKHEQNIECGGGYIKIFPADFKPERLNGDSQYSIMFGPDICGSSTKRIHLIFNYRGKNLLWKKDTNCETDKLTHVYTLLVRPDDTYEVFVDKESRASGSLYDDWDFLPPKEIEDPNEDKPDDWVDEKEIVDPDDVKPAGWDKIPEMIVDPEAVAPDDWDDVDDGEWEAPMIPNPEYKGEWKPRMIPNPEYKGEWKPKMIENPEYFEDTDVHVMDMAHVGVEVWQVKSGSLFDNFIVTDSLEEAFAFADETSGAMKEDEKKALDRAEEEKREREEKERKQREEDRKRREEEEEEFDSDYDSDEDSDDEFDHNSRLDEMKRKAKARAERRKDEL